MSYASIAKHNIAPGDHGAEPDQHLANSNTHFEGEHEAHADLDSKLNILPAGEDPAHPHIKPSVQPRPDPVGMHAAPFAEGPHVSEVAPTPTPAPKKDEVNLPVPGEQWEAAKAKASEATKETKQKANEVGREAKVKANEVGREAKDKANELSKEAKATAKDLKKKAKAELNEAEDKLGPYWEKTKDVVLRPGALGGLMGVVNVGILGTLGYFAYTRKDQPWDRRLVGGAVAGTLALFSAEGYVAESYLQTDEGREEAERAKREGSKLYLQAKERVLRPGVAGGLAGFVNVAVLGTVGYFSYKHWNEPWDRRIIAGVTAGLVALSGLEGWAGTEIKDRQ